jgi:hypothetical protein
MRERVGYPHSTITRAFPSSEYQTDRTPTGYGPCSLNLPQLSLVYLSLPCQATLELANNFVQPLSRTPIWNPSSSNNRLASHAVITYVRGPQSSSGRARSR